MVFYNVVVQNAQKKSYSKGLSDYEYHVQKYKK